MEEMTTQEPAEYELTDGAPNQEPEQEEYSEQEPESSFKIPVKYNGEEQVIDSMETAQELIQKGMNYDKVHSKLAALEEKNNEIAFFEQLANESGMSLSQLAEAMNQSRVETRANQLMETDGYDEATATALAKAEQLEGELQGYREKEQLEEQAETEISDFFKKYPQADLDKYDNNQEFWEDAEKSGIELAYLRQLNRERLTETANAKNSQTTPGKVGDINNKFEITSMEQIKQMTSSERHKHMNAIRKFITGKEQ